MKTTIKEITPEWATKVLETRNPNNRPISVPFVEKLARDISQNAFATTHQGIAFNENGDLLDGQHRLAAIVKANRPVSMVVTTDVPNTHRLNGVVVNTFELIDGGRKRGVGQMLQMAGFKNANRLAAIVRAIVNICAETKTFTSISTAQTHKALHYIGKSCEAIIEACPKKSMCDPTSGMMASIIFWHTVNPAAAVDFIQELSSITGQPSSPSRLLARWLKTHKMMHGGQTAIIHASVAASAIYHQNNRAKVEKLYASSTAMDWLLSNNRPMKSTIASIIK